MIGLRTCASLLSLAAALVFPSAVSATDYVVPAGTTDTTPKVLTDVDTLTIETNARQTAVTTPTVNQVGTANNVIIINNGTLDSQAAGGNAFITSGASLGRNIGIANNQGALIFSDDDAIRIGNSIGTGTVILNNSGTIASNVGQAIDFDAIGNTGGSVTINNAGTIRSLGEDAIRSGASTINNAGVIYGDGAAGGAFDGIDTQSRAATINNVGNGVISGLRSGVAANNAVTINNLTAASGTPLATIEGRNGAGILAGGTVTLTNSGTIVGALEGVNAGSVTITNGPILGSDNAARGGFIVGNGGAGVAAAGNGTVVNAGAIIGAGGDADGLRIYGVATITNTGLIRGSGATGTNAAGTANTSEGIVLGGGTIANAAGATISGGNNGIVTDDGATGLATRTTAIVNDGAIIGNNGAGIRLTGTFNNTITNTGTITGTNGPAISTGSGNDTLNNVGTITGAVSLGAGDDRLQLLPGSVITGVVDGGDGTDAITLGGTTGQTGTFAGSVNFETLSVQAATWIVTGTSTYSGGITVNNGGRLDNRGTLLGTTAVNNGEVLGTGTFQSLSVSGATSVVRPGGTGTTGTITVTGDYVQSNRATLAVDITAAGAADRLTIGGAASLQTNAALAITKAAGTYVPGTRFTLLTAGGGLTGTFGSVTADSDPLTLLRVNYSTNAVTLDVLRSAAGFTTAATTPNQLAVATAIGMLDINNPLYTAVGSIVSNTTLAGTLDALSGEVHASAHLGMALDARRMASSAASRIDLAPEGSGVWLQAIGASGSANAANGAAGMKHDIYGAMGGADVFTADHMRGGLALGYARDSLDVSARASHAKIGAVQAMLYGGGAFGQVHFKLAAGYSWAKLHTTRAVALPTPETARASYSGTVVTGTGELSYDLPLGPVSALPFASAQVMHVTTNNATETGGIAALSIASNSDNFQSATAGLRIVSTGEGAIAFRASAGFQRAFGNRVGKVQASFAGATSSFNTFGAPQSRNAAVVDLDVFARLGETARIGIGYSGLIGDQGHDHAGKVTFALGL